MNDMENTPSAIPANHRKPQHGYTHRVTFPVHDVALLHREIPQCTPEKWLNDRVLRFTGFKLGAAGRFREGSGPDWPNLVMAEPEKHIADAESLVGKNSFMDCVYHAYAGHRRLILNPDSLWLLICQGFALHIRQNPEEYRAQLVTFDEKWKLLVAFEKYPMTPEEWEPIFLDFQRQIEAKTQPGIVSLFAAPFSGTSRTTQLAFTLSLMNINHHYFEAIISCICGIPEITLEGTPEDWEQLEARVEALAKFDLEWWLSALRPVLREFTAASKGRARWDFWQKIIDYRVNPSNRCDPGLEKRLVIDGWINYFFPYIVRDYKLQQQHFQGNEPPKLTMDEYPSGCTVVGITGMNCNSAQAVSGFMSFTVESADGALKPNISWSVNRE